MVTMAPPVAMPLQDGHCAAFECRTPSRYGQRRLTGRYGAAPIDASEERGLGGIPRGLATSGPTRYSGKIIPRFALIIFC